MERARTAAPPRWCADSCARPEDAAARRDASEADVDRVYRYALRVVERLLHASVEPDENAAADAIRRRLSARGQTRGRGRGVRRRHRRLAQQPGLNARWALLHTLLRVAENAGAGNESAIVSLSALDAAAALLANPSAAAERWPPRAPRPEHNDDDESRGCRRRAWTRRARSPPATAARLAWSTRARVDSRTKSSPLRRSKTWSSASPNSSATCSSRARASTGDLCASTRVATRASWTTPRASRPARAAARGEARGVRVAVPAGACTRGGVRGRGRGGDDDGSDGSDGSDGYRGGRGSRRGSRRRRSGGEHPAGVPRRRAFGAGGVLPPDRRARGAGAGAHGVRAGDVASR